MEGGRKGGRKGCGSGVCARRRRRWKRGLGGTARSKNKSIPLCDLREGEGGRKGGVEKEEQEQVTQRRGEEGREEGGGEEEEEEQGERGERAVGWFPLGFA